MAGKPSPVEIVLKGVDRVTGPISKINAKLAGMQKPVRELSRSFSAVGAQVGKLAFQVAAVGGALGIAAVGGMKKFIDSADAIEEAATAAGVSAGELDGALRKFSTSLGQAKLGTGGLNAMLSKSAPKLLANMKAAGSTGEALDLFLDAAERAKDPSLRNALLASGFGRSGSLLAPMLEGLKDTRKEAVATGNVLTVETIRAAAKTADEFGRAGKTVRGLANAFASELLPKILEVVRRINAWTNANRDLVRVQVVKFAQDVARIVGTIADNLPGAIERVRQMVDAIGGWRNILIGLVAIKLAPFIASVYALTIALATNPVGQIVLAVSALVTVLVLAIKHWDALKARVMTFGGFSQMVGGAVPGIGPALSAGRTAWDLGASKLLDQMRRPQEAPTGHVVIEDARGSLKVREVRASGMDLSWLTGPIMSDG